MKGIIDFHVHPYLGQEQNMCFYKEYHALTPEECRNYLESTGITHICGSVIEGGRTISDFSYLRELNRLALELKERLGDFYTPGFHVHPKYVKESCEEIERMYKNKVRLIGELVPYMHDWEGFEEKAWDKILDAADACKMVLSYHTAFACDMSRFIEAHPHMTFVAAHPGEKAHIMEHIEMMKKYDNLYLDLSGTGLFRFCMLKFLVEQVGADRILFGTDYPICNPRMYVQAVYGEALSEKERNLILYENAARILGL